MLNLVLRRLFPIAVTEAALLTLLWAAPAAAQTGIGFVQVAAAVPQSPQSAVAVTFTATQTAGNLNVVVIGWNDTTAQVQSVTDTRGNVYVRAVGPTVRSGLGTQSIYYAANIAAASAAGNTVTAIFNVPAQYVDMRIAEYRGIRQTSPVDVVAGAGGSGSTSNSGAVTTTNANDLLVGANLVASRTKAAGASYTSRIITDPDGDILEDRIVTTTGNYSATASTNGGAYVMQMVAFRGAPADSQAPTAPTGLTASAATSNQVTLGWTASTDNVAVTTYLVERCPGAACSNFTQVGTSSTLAYTDGTVADSTSYSYRVRATDAAGNLGPYSNTATAATPAGPDTQAPTTPAGLGATPASSTQVNLAWTASTDNVAVTAYLIERCLGVSCVNFTQVGTSPSASYNDSVAASSTYRYRVRATDAAANLSGYSNVASATTPGTPDTEAPTAPAGASATAASSTQVMVAWTASSDNVGVTNYLVERCEGTGCASFTQIGTSGTLSYSDTTVVASTSYSYRIRATDAATNLSSYSGEASVTTPAPPVGATLVQHTGRDAGTVNSSTLSFAAANASGNWIGVAIRASQTGQVFTVSDTRGNTYRKAIQFNETADGTTLALYYAENVAAGANTVTVSTSIVGTLRFAIFEYSGVATANSLDVATSAQGTSATPSSGGVTTTAAGDLVIGLISTANAATFTAGTGFTIEERVPAAPNTKLLVEDRLLPSPGTVAGSSTLGGNDSWGALVAAFKPAVAAPDTQAPTAPGAATATAGTSTQVTVAWTASSDNIGVTNYLVERCQGVGCASFAQIGTSGTLNYNDTTVVGSTSYNYRLRATDAAANLSGYSNVASVTTPAPPDTQVPTAPATLTATAVSGSQIDLSWAVATDNVAVTQYLIERCQGVSCARFAQIATTTTPAFSSTGLTTGTSYSYRVRATDAASNLGPYSPVATATPPDTQAPTAPATLAATAVSASRIDLSWTASTDNVGVTQYLIERCQDAGCASFTQVATAAGLTFSNTGLATGTSYSYQVRATDAAGNVGAYSPVASATTPAPDTEAPTAPATLTATATSGTQIGLSWAAAADNVGVTQYQIERCQGAGCTTFAQIATTPALSFSNTGLANGTSYSYRVRATDAAGNSGPYSPEANATTPDTQTPTAPTTLTATATSASQIDLSWATATDNVGVTQYLIERCQGVGCTTFAQIAATTSLTFSNTGLTNGTSYGYRVRATDAAGNLGPYSPVANSTTPGTATIAFVQTANAVPQSSPSTVSVTYLQPQTAGNLNVVVVGWNSASGTVQSVQDSVGNVYTRAVGPTVRSGFATQSVYYAAGVLAAGANTNTVTVTFAAPVPFPDIRIAEYSGIATTNPVDVVAAAQGSGTSSNSGTATTTNANDLIVGANIVSTHTTGPGAGFTSRVITVPDGDILEDRIVTTTGAYSAVAPLTSGAWIMQMVAFKGGNAVVDLQPPTPPASVVATATSGSDVTVSWSASTDNVGVVGYRVERCQGVGCATFGEVGTVAVGTTFSDSGLTPTTSYSYRVRAVDRAGNYSAYSAQADVVTATPDTEPPSAPTNLVATAASGTRIDLTWTPSTDNVSVASYRVERCQGAGCTLYVKLATVFSPSFTDTGLTPNTTYQYIVRAVDGSSNLGDYSNEAAATTLATIPELVAAYSFDEGSGTTVTDSSDKGNSGAIGTAVWSTTGKYGNALSFNGTSAKVVVPDSASLRLTTAMTLEAWVNPTAGNGGWTDVVYKGDDNYFLEAYTSSGGPAAGATLGNVNTVAQAGSLLPINTWTHLAETYDGTTLRLYINGALAASVARSGLILTSSNPLEIGGDRIYGQYFSGLIDEVRIFNVARTPSQIQADMNTPLGTSLPVMNLSATALDFGSQQTGHVSAPQVITVQNLGGVTMTIGSITIGGFNNGDFAYTTTCGASLAASASCTITVSFTPAAAGARSATLSIGDNAPGAPHTVTLTGSGIGFTISPRTATLTPNVTQQFAWTGGSPDVTFSVDGVASGNATVGVVSAAGLYTPPSSAGVHVVTVTSADGTQTSSATIYITTHPGVFTHHNDNFRTGQNVAETVLTPASVTSATFGKLASFSLDGIAHASPLYVSGVNVPGKGVRNVVYVATEHNSVYAFDADGLSPSPLWQVSFLSAGVTTVPSGDTGECCDIAPEIGITGTPVIDPSSGTLYVVAKTKEGSGQNAVYRQRLHALDITTGAEKFGGPAILQASVAGSGAGSQGGVVPFDALHENQRPALLLSNGVVYITFGSHGDIQPYHGWVLGYNATTLQQVMAFNSSPNADGAGMWMANGGPAADAAGNIYSITGNGRFDANTGSRNYGTSFLKLSPTGSVLDYFTPHNQATSSASNFDLGAAGPMLLPDQPGPHPRLMISAGKDNTVYLLDRDAMGQYNANNDNQIVQSLVNIFPFGTPEPGNYSSPVYFNGTVYFGPVADTVQAFTLTNGLLSTSPTSSTSMAFSYPGASLSISANGIANGIVWAIQRNGDCGVQSTCGSAAPGVLRAFDASNLGVQLYASDQAGTRDQLDFAAKFSVPVVVNGKVFVTTTGRLTIFGLLQ